VRTVNILFLYSLILPFYKYITAGIIASKTMAMSTLQAVAAIPAFMASYILD
jgi:hypothetical protein